MVKVVKFKQRGTILFSTQGSLDVNLFLSYQAEAHAGQENILDLLNSKRAFIPVEDVLTNEILLIGKTRIVHVTLDDRNEGNEAPGQVELPVILELLSGETVEGSLFTDLPDGKKRLSDYLDLSGQFICLRQEKSDLYSFREGKVTASKCLLRLLRIPGSDPQFFPIAVTKASLPAATWLEANTSFSKLHNAS